MGGTVLCPRRNVSGFVKVAPQSQWLGILTKALLRSTSTVALPMRAENNPIGIVQTKNGRRDEDREEQSAGLVAMAILATGIGTLPGIREASGADTDRTMNVVRIYTGADGQSHFEDVAVPLKDGGKVGFLSERIAVKGVLFRVTEGDYNYDFHTAPRRQYVVNL